MDFFGWEREGGREGGAGLQRQGKEGGICRVTVYNVYQRLFVGLFFPLPFYVSPFFSLFTCLVMLVIPPFLGIKEAGGGGGRANGGGGRKEGRREGGAATGRVCR